MSTIPVEQKKTARILLIDDDRADYVITRDLLDDVPHTAYDVAWASGLAEARAALESGSFDAVLLDYMLGGETGVDVLRAMEDQFLHTPVIILTALTDRAIDEAALEAGAEEFLTKDTLDSAMLDRTIRYAIEKHRLRDQITQSRDDIRSILDGLRIGTAITRDDGECIGFASQAFQRFVDVPRGRIVGERWQEVLSVADGEHAAIEDLLSMPAKERSKIPLHYKAKNGQCFWLELEVIDDPNHPARKIFVLYDVSDVHGLRKMLDERNEFHDILGKSERMQTIFAQVRELARYDTTVLVEGETGTGKELVARALHYSGPRASKPFIAVNCAGLTESLLASQLFGHKKGAFTGAVSDHKGFFEAANGGTVFLDEIGDIPPTVQTMLLRVSQEREIVRVGESVTRPIDIRLISATNRNLTAMAEDGSFRSDLLYRLRVARINIPPLCERREDIPLLANHFLSAFSTRSGKAVHTIAPASMNRLYTYSWPGNVRELQNAIEAAAVCAQRAEIQPEDLPPEFHQESGANDASLPGAGEPDPFDEAERIQEALSQTGGNRAKAARLLGISRATLYRRLAEMDE